MLRIIKLLNQRNHYLEKFYSLNESELLNFSRGIFDTLESFYQMRDKMLDIIKYIDSEIDQTLLKDDDVQSVELKPQIREALAIKEEYVNRIIAQDLEILECIETAKSNIIKELQSINRTKNAVGRYKSGIGESRRLDEEV